MNTNGKRKVMRPRLLADITHPDRERLIKKISRLSPKLQSLFPDPRKLSFKDFWVTPTQAGAICGGMRKDAVIERMYEGSAFFNCINIGRTKYQPYFRIPLEDCVDFLLEHCEGFQEAER